MSMLHQILAVEDSKKKKLADTLTQAYHLVQKEPLFNGLSRTYTPKDDEGERLPSENQVMQARVSGLIQAIKQPLKDYWSVIRTRDEANCKAKADVVIKTDVVLKGVPVSHLLFLEKQMTDVITFISKLPVLDPSEDWVFDPTTDSYATSPKETVRTKKVPKAFVKYPATDKHPAQVETFTEDVVAGYWKAIKFSGAIPANAKNSLLAKAQEVKDAIVKARQVANTITLEDNHDDEVLLNYIFG